MCQDITMALTRFGQWCELAKLNIKEWLDIQGFIKVEMCVCMIELKFIIAVSNYFTSIKGRFSNTKKGTNYTASCGEVRYITRS